MIVIVLRSGQFTFRQQAVKQKILKGQLASIPELKLLFIYPGLQVPCVTADPKYTKLATFLKDSSGIGQFILWYCPTLL